MLNWDREAPLRGVGTPDKPFGFYDATVDGGWEVPASPTRWPRAASSPGGGRACWAGAPTTGRGIVAAVRPAGLQAEQPRRPGRRLADQLRRPGALVRQDREADRASSARTIGPAERAGLAAGLPAAAAVPRVPDLLLKAAFEEWASRASRRTARRDHPADGGPQHLRLRHARAAAAAPSAPTSSRPRCCSPPAMKTGNLTITTNAMVYQVDRQGRQGQRHQLCRPQDRRAPRGEGEGRRAGGRSGETARILLNSKSAGSRTASATPAAWSAAT